MRSAGKILFALCIILIQGILLSSCKKDLVYNVPASIQPYVDEFISEAALRGITLEIDELVVLFEQDLVVDGIVAAGLCQRSNRGTPTIKLDTTSINWRSNLSSREQLIFHELGHCVLDRSHLEDRLANGNYKTTMRPSGEQIYGPVMTAFKRSYYMDEMYDENVSSPSWSVNALAYDDINPGSKTIISNEEFDDESGEWSTGGNTTNTIRSIFNGVYILEVVNPDNYYVGNVLEINAGADFELEAGVHVDGDGFAGILWAGEEREEIIPSFSTVFFDDDVISIGTIDDGTESSYVYEEFFTEFYNKVTIRRIGNSYYFYVNENLVDNMNFLGINGDQIGVSFGGVQGVKILFDYIRLSYID